MQLTNLSTTYIFSPGGDSELHNRKYVPYSCYRCERQLHVSLHNNKLVYVPPGTDPIIDQLSAGSLRFVIILVINEYFIVFLLNLSVYQSSSLILSHTPSLFLSQSICHSLHNSLSISLFFTLHVSLTILHSIYLSHSICLSILNSISYYTSLSLSQFSSLSHSISSLNVCHTPTHLYLFPTPSVSHSITLSLTHSITISICASLSHFISHSLSHSISLHLCFSRTP